MEGGRVGGRLCLVRVWRREGGRKGRARPQPKKRTKTRRARAYQFPLCWTTWRSGVVSLWSITFTSAPAARSRSTSGLPRRRRRVVGVVWFRSVGRYLVVVLLALVLWCNAPTEGDRQGGRHRPIAPPTTAHPKPPAHTNREQRSAPVILLNTHTDKSRARQRSAAHR